MVSPELFKIFCLNFLLIQLYCLVGCISHGNSTNILKTSITTEITTNRPFVEHSHSYFRDVSIRPHFKDGKASGLLIVKDSLFIKILKLKSGDVILKCDDVKIDSVESAMIFYAGLKKAKKLSIQILRNSNVITLNYTFTE